jgi:hypothetical protein
VPLQPPPLATAGTTSSSEVVLPSNTLAHAVDAYAHQITVSPLGWSDVVVPYEQIIVATGGNRDDRNTGLLLAMQLDGHRAASIA